MLSLGNPVGVPVTAESSFVDLRVSNSFDNSSVIFLDDWKSDVFLLSVTEFNCFSASLKKSLTDEISFV